MMAILRSAFLLLSAGFVFSLPTSSAIGSLVASDSFAYVSGSLNGNTGGSGFGGAWADVAGDTTNPLVIDPTSLTYPGITSTGGSVKLPSNTAYSDSQRALAVPQSTGTYYFSALGQTISDAGMYLGVGLGGDLANGGSNYTVYLQYSQQRKTSTFHIKHEFDGEQSSFFELAGTGVFLIVGRLSLTAGDDTLDVWINPAFGSEPAGAANVSLTGFDLGALTHVFIDGGGTSSPTANARLDELKLGTVYNDVVPLPEPTSTLGLLTGSALLLAARARPATSRTRRRPIS